MTSVYDEAICLRQWDWSETSQTAVLFTRGMGVLRVLAKGSKRPKAPYSGGLEMLTRGDLGVILRPNTELALLTEWDLREAYPWLRTHLGAHHAGLYVADLVLHVVRDHDPHPGLYESALRCLREVSRPDAVGGALARLQWSALREAGYSPVIEADVRSGEALAPARSYLFSPTLGGFVPDLDPGGPGESESGGERVWRVRAATLELMRRLARADREGKSHTEIGGGPAGEEPAEDLARVNRLMASYLRHILGEEPPTMSVVFPGKLSR